MSNSDFNPRSREGSDDCTILQSLLHPVFQSTLPRGERLKDLAPTVSANAISIHAPARGATLSLYFLFRICSDFNPRSREGSDNVVSLKFMPTTAISIHAPARGATSKQPHFAGTITFQSTLPRGERPYH